MQNYSHRTKRLESGCPVRKTARLPQLRLRGGMQLFLKTLSGKTISLMADPDDNIAALKSAMKDRTGIPEGCQRLVCAGRDLVGDDLVGDLQAYRQQHYLAKEQRHLAKEKQ